MITTNDIIQLDSEGTTLYDSPAIVCLPSYNILTGIVRVELSVQNQTTEAQVAYYYYEYTDDTINGVTTTEADTVEIFMEAVEARVKQSLEAINPSATFTI